MKAVSLNILGLFFLSLMMKATPSGEAALTDSLLRLANQYPQNDTMYYNLMDKLIDHYTYTQPDSAIYFAKQTIHFADSLGMEYQVSSFYNSLGLIHRVTGRIPEALSYYKKALSRCDTNNNRGYYAVILGNIGLTYAQMEDYTNAIPSLEQALLLHKVNGSKDGVASVYNNLGSLYAKQGFYVESKRFFVEAYKVWERHGPPIKALYGLNNIGAIFQKMGEVDSAIFFMEKGLSLSEKLQENLVRMTLLGNLGNIYYSKNDFHTSAAYYLQSIQIEKKYSLSSENWVSHKGLSRVYQKLGKFSEAEQEGLLAYQYVNQSGTKKEKREVLLLLGELYALKKDYFLAYTHYKKSGELADTILKETKEFDLQRFISRMGYKSKLDSIQSIQATELLVNEKDAMRKKWIIAFGVFIILFLVILYWQTRHALGIKSNLVAELSRKNQEILQHQSQILLKAKELKALDERRSKVFSVLSHDLISPFRTFKGALGLYANKLMSGAEVNESSQVIQHQLDVNIQTLQNLLEWAKNQLTHGNIEIHPEKVDLKELVKSVLEQISLQSQSKNLTVINEVENDIIVSIEKSQIEIVIRNILSNAVKYSHSGGEIRINSLRFNHKVIVKVTDQGVGMSSKQLEMLLNTSNLFTTPGTKDEMGSGIGLMLCKEFLEENGGTLMLESEKGKGTTVSFSIPLVSR